MGFSECSMTHIPLLQLPYRSSLRSNWFIVHLQPQLGDACMHICTYVCTYVRNVVSLPYRAWRTATVIKWSRWLRSLMTGCGSTTTTLGCSLVRRKEERKDIRLPIIYSTRQYKHDMINSSMKRSGCICAVEERERETKCDITWNRYCKVTLQSSLIFGESKDARQNICCLTSLSHEYDQVPSYLRIKKAVLTDGLVASSLRRTALYCSAKHTMPCHAMPCLTLPHIALPWVPCHWLTQTQAREGRLKKFIQELSSYNFLHACL